MLHSFSFSGSHWSDWTQSQWFEVLCVAILHCTQTPFGIDIADYSFKALKLKLYYGVVMHDVNVNWY